MAVLAVFAAGLIFGSFANVITLRLNTGESLIFGGSRCFYCGRSLKWFELVPVLSFLFLRGRCRQCGSKISWQYPAVEFASGLLFLLIWSEQGSDQFGQSLALTITQAVFFWLLLVISVYDIRHKIIPNSLVYLAISVSFLTLVIGYWSLFGHWLLGIGYLMPHLLSALGLFSFFAILWAVSKGTWMGFGDAKMAFAIGLFLGWPGSVMAFLFSFWFGAVFALGVIALKGLKNVRGAQIPFGPFLFLGGLTAFLWGDAVIRWYISLL